MKRATFRDRVRYRFDNFMSRGTVALVAALFTLTCLVVLIATLIMVFARLRPLGGSETMGFPEALWQVLMRTIDTGTTAGDVGWSARILGLLITLGGIFIASALIGILANGLDNRLGELRRGRSRVIETGHTVILGWSPQVFSIIAELALANRHLRTDRGASDARRNACLAILADKDKVEMEEEIRIKVPDTMGTRVVCRSGNPLDLDDLQIVSPDTARAIIIVSPGGQFPDMPVAKSMLALGKGRSLRKTPYHIVAAIHKPTNIEIARIIGGAEAQLFMVDRLIAYIIAQTCRQSGLSVVYSELFSFAGAALYFREEPGLVGVTYEESLYRFNHATLVGVQSGDGRVTLNPPSHTILQAGDRVIALAASPDSIRLSDQMEFPVQQEAIQRRCSTQAPLERLLILGWNRRAPLILEQLNLYVAPGSQARVVAAVKAEQMQADMAGVQLDQLAIAFENGNPTDRLTLEKLCAEDFHYIIILNPMEAMDPQIADASIIITLLHLRDIAHKNSQQFSIVSEILDARNRDLAEVTSAEDVIISERLVALALTQLAENKDIAPVFIDLLTPSGTEIYLKPVADYLVLDESVNFYTLLAAAQEKGETAIGYRLLSEAADSAKSFGVHLNPDKSEKIQFGESDRIIILSTN